MKKIIYIQFSFILNYVIGTEHFCFDIKEIKEDSYLSTYFSIWHIMLILVSLQRVKNEKTKKQNKKVTLISSPGILPKKKWFWRRKAYWEKKECIGIYIVWILDIHCRYITRCRYLLVVIYIFVCFLLRIYTFYLENFAQGAQVMKNRCTFSFRTAETLRYSHADVFLFHIDG